VAAYDRKKDEFGVYFFDGAGARFQNGSYACAGSGSERIRGVFEYIARQQGRFETRPLGDVLKDGLTMLDIAADLDSATGGFQKTLPVARVLDRDGNREIGESELQQAVDAVLAG
jgi:proteasome beta subunit